MTEIATILAAVIAFGLGVLTTSTRRARVQIQRDRAAIDKEHVALRSAGYSTIDLVELLKSYSNELVEARRALSPRTGHGPSCAVWRPARLTHNGNFVEMDRCTCGFAEIEDARVQLAIRLPKARTQTRKPESPGC